MELAIQFYYTIEGIKDITIYCTIIFGDSVSILEYRNSELIKFCNFKIELVLEMYDRYDPDVDEYAEHNIFVSYDNYVFIDEVKIIESLKNIVKINFVDYILNNQHMLNAYKAPDIIKILKNGIIPHLSKLMKHDIYSNIIEPESF